MDPASLILAVIGTLDLCVNCRSIRSLSDTVKQLEMKISAAVVGLGIIDRRSLGLSGSKLPIDIKGVYLK
ncbi:hypothetical protein PENARI_c009G10882 [Penicillium arizonense]|uniref:Uncharacterized protein n=1 Tax=Penicillium arizonense TaxID=1835702 RepID=A0A1F5LHT8_PENAI|nr:hypothetical protein PENARI_c009G10882 [Penicillium arizonense]OGE52705.1 hypothetical protein PENARI_c009G10882 [Penicillium arizonense]